MCVCVCVLLTDEEAVEPAGKAVCGGASGAVLTGRVAGLALPTWILVGVWWARVHHGTVPRGIQLHALLTALTRGG